MHRMDLKSRIGLRSCRVGVKCPVEMSDVPPLTSSSESESESEDSNQTEAVFSALQSFESGEKLQDDLNNVANKTLVYKREFIQNDKGDYQRTSYYGNMSDGSAEDEDDDNEDDAEESEEVYDDEDDDSKERDDVINLPDEMPSYSMEQEIGDVVTHRSNHSVLDLESKLQSCLEQATAAFFNRNYLSSVSEYKVALMMLTDIKLKDNHDNLWLMKYCLGLSLINLTLVKEIHEGEKVFRSLIDEGETEVCVLGYLGLAKAYLKQNRFLEAISPLQEGIRLINAGLYPSSCCMWPGTSIVMTETDDLPRTLKNLFEQLLGECRNPPQPVAICRYSFCSDPIKIQMYLTDPEFKGYIQVACFEKCLMEYHRDCWRQLKAKQLDKRSDKELVGGSCMTPDCQSTVCKVVVFGSDGKVQKMLTADEGSSRLKKSGKKHKNMCVQQGKAATQKKVGGKKAKGGMPEEKVKAEEGAPVADCRSRTGETLRHREDAKPGETTASETGRGVRINQKRKSLDASESADAVNSGVARKKGQQECDSSLATTSVDPLVTVQRTDFVTLQRKRNEELESENLSRKGKKRREKEKPKKAIHLDEFVEKMEYDVDAGEHQFLQPGSDEFWVVPPYRTSYIPQSQSKAWVFPDEDYFEYSNSIPDVSVVPVVGNSQADYASVLHHAPATDGKVSAAVSAAATVTPVSSVTLKGTSLTADQSKKSSHLEDSKGIIMSRFEMLLAGHGPCLPDEEVVQQELETFSIDEQVLISEVGGIAKLLLQSLKFTLVDGYICLLKDAAKARQMARQRRIKLLGETNFIKRFGGVQPLVKEDPSSVSTNPSSSVSGVIPTSIHFPDPPSSGNIVTSNNTKLVTVSSNSVNIDSITKINKAHDKSMLGLCDLNEYKEMMKRKNSPTTISVSSSSIEDDSKLSVIEKFKKQVHIAASKEKNKVPPSSDMPASMPPPLTPLISTSVISSSSYSKPFVGDSKHVASVGNGIITEAENLTSLSRTVVEIQSRSSFKEVDVSSFQNNRDAVDVVSNLLDIDDDREGKRFVNSTKIIQGSGLFLQPVSKNSKAISRSDCTLLSSSSGIKSTLSALANEFSFPLVCSSYESNRSTFTTTVESKGYKPSSNDIVSNLRVFEPEVKYFDYGTAVSSAASSSDNGSASSDLSFGKQVPSLATKLVSDTNHMYRHTQERGTNTDQSILDVYSSEAYEYMRCEHNDLMRRYKTLGDKQVMLQSKHAEELRIIRERLKMTNSQLENAEKKSVQLEKASNQWQLEKTSYEEELEKLQSDLSYMKTSLESANNLVEVTDHLLRDTQNALRAEQEERQALREKYESLLRQLEHSVRGNVNRSETFLSQLNSNSNALVPTTDSTSRTGKKTKHNFDKIINSLAEMFPNLSRIEMSRCVLGVRLSRNNTLSGLTVQEIVALVRDFILNEQAVQQLKTDVLELPYALPTSGKYSGRTNGTPFGEEVFQEEMDPCIICHEELNTESASMLDCGHSFHTECVRKWFREQSTCPTCRNHALLPDEFPALGRAPFY